MNRRLNELSLVQEALTVVPPSELNVIKKIKHPSCKRGREKFSYFHFHDVTRHKVCAFLFIMPYSRSIIIAKFSLTISIISTGKIPIFFTSLLLSIALSWSIIMSQGWWRFAVSFFKWTLNISASLLTLVEIGHTIVDGCGILFNKLV